MSELGVKDNTCRVVKRGFLAVGTRHEAKYSEYPTVIPQSFDSLISRMEEIQNRTGEKLALYEPGNMHPITLEPTIQPLKSQRLVLFHKEW